MDAKEIDKKLKEYLELIYYKGVVLALYDVSDVQPFEPLVYPPLKVNTCIFAFYKSWKDCKTLVLTKERSGCGGAGRYLCGGKLARERQEFIDFLYKGEGLRASEELIVKMIDNTKTYKPKGEFILLGPFRAEHIDKMVSVTLFVDPDRLAPLIHSAFYHSESPSDDVVVAPMGSGCSLLYPFINFKNPEKPRSAIGATDMAMRRFLPSNTLTFTMNMPMFYQVIEIDDNHFLRKHFWQTVVKKRRWRR